MVRRDFLIIKNCHLSLSSNLNEWEEESLKFNYATNEDDIGKNGTD